MTIEPEEYVALNQPDNENPSTVSFIQDHYENLKNKIINVGIGICATLLVTFNIVQVGVGMVMINDCSEDTYTPTYFVVAGVIGTIAKIGHFILQRNKRCPKMYQICYPFYIFEFFWLIAGTYYYILTVRLRQGCTAPTYTLAYWLVISQFICLKVCLLVFCWAVTMIFAVVYFKNKIVHFLAKSIRF